MKRMSGLLGDAIKRREVLRAARAQRVLREWPEVVGEVLAARSHPDRYEQGTVWVSVTGSAWAQELRMRESEILARFAERCGDPHLIVSLRFGVRPLPEDEPWERPKPRVPDPALKNMSIREIAERTLAKLERQKAPPSNDDKNGTSL